MIDTDIKSTNRPDSPRFPTRGIGAAFLAAAKIIGDATELAYVAPYQTGVRPSRADTEADEQGRNPNW